MMRIASRLFSKGATSLQSVTAWCMAEANMPRRCCSRTTIIERLAAFIPLAPLHQPHNLAVIRAMRASQPQLPQVACFDTAFHRSQPPLAQAFAIPRKYAEAGVQALRLPRHFLRICDGKAERRRPRARPGARHCRASRQRREPLRRAQWPKRRQHHGLYRRRRSHDGHALRRARPRRAHPHDGPVWHGRPRARGFDLSPIRPARRVGHFLGHARFARLLPSPRQKRRSRFLSTASSARSARLRRRSGGSTPSSSPAALAKTTRRRARRSWPAAPGWDSN